MSSEARAETNRRSGRLHYWILAIPFLWQLALAPVVNGIVVTWCPIPFPMLWQMIGVVLSSVLIATVFWIDQRNEAAAPQGAPE